MVHYIIRRGFLMILTLLLVSIVSFAIIQLPPGDFVSHYIASLGREANTTDSAEYDALRHHFGLDEPQYVQYLKWMRNLLRGDWGMSLDWRRPVRDLIGDRVMLTLVISVSTLLVQWLVAFPIGIYSAVKQYSIADYVFSAISFIGVGIPSFLLALVVMYTSYQLLGYNVVGLFSPGFQEAAWSLAKVQDLLKHLWAPLLILAVGGTAHLIRTMRALMLDELHKPYVVTARAKGLTERRLLAKYPVRLALNPFVSTVGWALPGLISGTTIVSIVLGLPTTGPLLLQALRREDMYLAASFIMLLSALTVVGTFLSDVLLAALDPRIRLTS
jgi:peptide/nickel transport system permease protein